MRNGDSLSNTGGTFFFTFKDSLFVFGFILQITGFCHKFNHCMNGFFF